MDGSGLNLCNHIQNFLDGTNLCAIHFFVSEVLLLGITVCSILYCIYCKHPAGLSTALKENRIMFKYVDSS